MNNKKPLVLLFPAELLDLDLQLQTVRKSSLLVCFIPVLPFSLPKTQQVKIQGNCSTLLHLFFRTAYNNILLGFVRLMREVTDPRSPREFSLQLAKHLSAWVSLGLLLTRHYTELPSNHSILCVSIVKCEPYKSQHGGSDQKIAQGVGRP